MALSSAWYYCSTDICQKGILQRSILSIIIIISLYFERMSSMQGLFLFSSIKLSTSEKMKMVEKAAMEADKDLSSYILKGITEELSFNYLKSKLNMPCSKDTYYDRYRKFFWHLDQLRD